MFKVCEGHLDCTHGGHICRPHTCMLFVTHFVKRLQSPHMLQCPFKHLVLEYSRAAVHMKSGTPWQ